MGKFGVLDSLFLFLGLFVLTLPSCGSNSGNNGYDELVFNESIPADDVIIAVEQHSSMEDKDTNIIIQSTTVDITVGSAVFTAVFEDNVTAQALINQMPVTFDMADLNHNEKFYYLPENLPGDLTEKPVTIHAGEIMCWSGNCLVLFYDTFSNSYGGYMRIGYIEDITGLTEAVGNGNISVTFSRSNGN